MADQINYEAVEIPEAKPLEEYTYAERRAEILERINEAGHPRLINQAAIAEEFGCSAPNIHKDVNALGEFVDESLGDRRELNTKAVVERSIKGLIEQEEWQEAAQMALEYDEWIRETKDLQELMD